MEEEKNIFEIDEGEGVRLVRVVKKKKKKKT